MCALGNERSVQGSCDEAPFGGGIGMRQAAAEGAAHSNRVVRDMALNGSQQCAERIFGDRFVKRRMTHTGADRKDLAVTRDLVEADDVVDVDEVGGLSRPTCQNRDAALSS